MANKVGIHLHQTAKDLAALLAIGFGCYTILDIDAPHYVPAILEQSPDALILIRAYHPNVLAQDPHSWAAHCADQLAKWDRKVTHITPGNELNLPGEGGGWGRDDYRRINAWLLAWAEAFRPLCPWATIHWPALSPGHSEDQPDLGYVAYTDFLQESVAAFDILDVHCYWKANGSGLRDAEAPWWAFRFEKVHQLFPEKTLFISEFNRIWERGDARIAEEYRFYYQEILKRPYVLGATSFLWSSDDPAFAEMRWLGEERLIRTIAAMPKEASSTPTNPVKLPSNIYWPLIIAAKRHALEPELVAAVCQQESGFDPEAIGDAGHSVGLMQLHDQGAGHGLSVQERKDPATNLEVGSRYLANMIDRTGSIEDGLSAYNQGYNGWQRRGRSANLAYVNSVLGHYRHFQRRGLAPESDEPCPPDPTPDIEEVGGIPIAFAFLKEYRRRGRFDGRPLGPAAYCGQDCVQSFESGAVYVWSGGRVHVLNDAV